MKKLLFASAVLLIIIVFGAVTLRFYNNSSEQISIKIEDVCDSINSGKWDEARKQISDIEKTWEKTEKTWDMLVDHFEIDNIEMSLKKSKQYIETKDAALSLGELETLKFMVEHIYKKEAFELGNIL